MGNPTLSGVSRIKVCPLRKKLKSIFHLDSHKMTWRQKMNQLCVDEAVRFFQDNPELFTEHVGLCDDIEDLIFNNDAFTSIQDMCDFVADLENPTRAMVEMDDYASEIIEVNSLYPHQTMIDKFNLIWCDVGRWICENDWESVVEQYKQTESYHEYRDDECVAVKDEMA